MEKDLNLKRACKVFLTGRLLVFFSSVYVVSLIKLMENEDFTVHGYAVDHQFLFDKNDF